MLKQIMGWKPATKTKNYICMWGEMGKIYIKIKSESGYC